MVIEYESNYLAHHGIKNQKWGVRNGPPYPLDKKDHNRVVNKKTQYGSGYGIMGSKYGVGKYQYESGQLTEKGKRHREKYIDKAIDKTNKYYDKYDKKYDKEIAKAKASGNDAKLKRLQEYKKSAEESRQERLDFLNDISMETLRSNEKSAARKAGKAALVGASIVGGTLTGGIAVKAISDYGIDGLADKGLRKYVKFKTWAATTSIDEATKFMANTGAGKDIGHNVNTILNDFERTTNLSGRASKLGNDFIQGTFTNTNASTVNDFVRRVSTGSNASVNNVLSNLSSNKDAQRIISNVTGSKVAGAGAAVSAASLSKNIGSSSSAVRALSGARYGVSATKSIGDSSTELAKKKLRKSIKTSLANSKGRQ